MGGRKFLFLVLSVLVFSHCSYKDSKYSTGQIWTYDTRPGEEKSTLTVVAVENNKDLGVIVSVFVDNLHVRTSMQEFNNLAHIPLSKEAMDKSAIRLRGYTRELPDYKESYNDWKKTFKNKKGQSVKDPVKVFISNAEKQLQK